MKKILGHTREQVYNLLNRIIHHLWYATAIEDSVLGCLIVMDPKTNKMIYTASISLKESDSEEFSQGVWDQLMATAKYRADKLGIRENPDGHMSSMKSRLDQAGAIIFEGLIFSFAGYYGGEPYDHLKDEAVVLMMANMLKPRDVKVWQNLYSIVALSGNRHFDEMLENPLPQDSAFLSNSRVLVS